MLPRPHVLDLISKLKNNSTNNDKPLNFNDFVEREKRGKHNVANHYENGWAVVKQFYDAKNSQLMGNKVVSIHKSLDDVPYENITKEQTLYPITKNLIHDYSVSGWGKFADMQLNEEVDVFANMRNKILDYTLQQTLSKSKKKPSEQEFMQMKSEIKQQLSNLPSNELVAQYNKMLGIKS